ncbi:uncharacterized protein LOC144926192 isoform X2 [Branchiostoma floridae x Branchiostoma belcheri]
METVNKMPRSPTFVDTEKTRQLWDLILDSIQSSNDVTGAEVCYLGAMTGHSLMLPCVSLFPQNFQEILNKQLIDRFMQKTLEEAKVLNWCKVSRPLTPVQTTGDGNCLLHAVSQYMWGIHDRSLALRRLLNRTMVADMTEDLKRRWNRSCKAHNQHVDLEYASLEWRQEWNIVVSMTDPTPNPPEANDLPYKSLEEFHIFVLANLLRRPIIILAEDVLHNFEGHTFAPIHFSGIYLPLRWKPEECVRSPIVLGYLQQHFTPLLSQEEAPALIGLATGEFAVPLVKHDLTMLTVQFLLEHEETQAKELLQKYLDLMELPYTRKESISMVLAAKLNLNPPPEEQDLIKDFFQAVEKSYKKPEEIQEAAEPEKVAQNKIPPPAVKKEKTEAGKEGKKCSSAGCDMYGTPEQNRLCTKCFRDSTVSKKPPGPAEAPALPPNSSMLMRECRTPGCQYFCSIATGEYCHECYEKNTGDQRRREMEAGRATQTAKEVQPPAGNPNKCITEGCNNDRNPDYENLCDVCFINVVTKSGQPPSVHPLKQTERSSSLGIIPTTPEPLHSVENRTNSQSLGHISDFTHPVKCIIPECPRIGYPKTNDMCKKCYIDQQGRVAGAVAAAVTTVARVLTHRSSTFTSAKTSTPGGSPTCKTVGCDMFGAPGQDWTKAKYFKKCKTPDCQKIGHENANGLCHECYPKDSNTGRLPDKSAAATNLPSSGPEELVPTGAEGSTNPQISTQSETRPLRFEMSSSSTLPLGPIDPLTVQFLLEHEETQAKELLQKYLDLMELPYTRKESISMVLAAKKNLCPEELVPTGAEGSTNPQISTQSETRPLRFEMSSSSTLPLGPIDPLTGDNNSTECLIEGCKNMKLENTGGRCYWCLKKGKIPQTPKPVTKPPTAPSSSSDPPAAASSNIVAAAVARDAQPVPMLVDRKQCPAPHCDAYGNAMYNGLCSKCFHTLQEYNSKKPEASALWSSQSPLPNGPHHSLEELPANTIITAGHGASVAPIHDGDAMTPRKGGYVTAANTPEEVIGPEEHQLPSASGTAVEPPADDPPPAYEDVVSSPPSLGQLPTQVASGGTSTVRNVHRDLNILMEKTEEGEDLTSEHYSMSHYEEEKEKSLPIPVTNNSIHTGRAAENREGDRLILHEKVEEFNAATDPQVDKKMEASSNMSAEASAPVTGSALRFGRDSCSSPNPAEEMPMEMEEGGRKLRRPREAESQAPPPKRHGSISSFDLYRSSPPTIEVPSEARPNNSPVDADNLSSKPKELVDSCEEEDTTPHSPAALSCTSDPIGSSTTAAVDPQSVPPVVDRKQCPAPHCDAYGDAMYKGLCSKCFHTLQEYNSKKPAASVSPLPNGPHHSSEELPANTIITAGHGASVVLTPGNVTMTTEEGGTVSIARTTTQVNGLDEPQLPCVNAAQGCEMFGTKEQMGFCFQCFGKHINQQPPVNQPHQPPVNHPPQPANQHQGETPLRVLAEVAGASHYAARLPRQRCIAPGCDMHGEPENINMCSKCYLRHLAEVHRGKDIEAHRAQNLHTNVEPPAAYPPRIIHATVQTGPYYPPPAYNPVVPEPQPTYAPPAYHNRQPCATPNCPNDGHPDQENLCAPCFQKFMSLMTPQQAATKWEPQAAYQKYVTQHANLEPPAAYPPRTGPYYPPLPTYNPVVPEPQRTSLPAYHNHRGKDIEAHRAQNLHTNVELPAADPQRPSYRPGRPCRGPGCQAEATDQLGFCAGCFRDSLASGELEGIIEQLQQSTRPKDAAEQFGATYGPKSGGICSSENNRWMRTRGTGNQYPLSSMHGMASLPGPGFSQCQNPIFNITGPVNVNLFPTNDPKALQSMFSSLPVPPNNNTAMQYPIDRSLQECKKPGCTNFGNVKCHGYCNACYTGKATKRQ